MESNEGKEGSSRCSRVTQPTTPTSPSLNLMEQLLLAKMERQSMSDVFEGEKFANKTLLLRTDSMDSQTSASTFSSVVSGDSAASNFYCKCDDCLLGIVDKHQQHPAHIGRKKKLRRIRRYKIFYTSHICHSDNCGYCHEASIHAIGQSHL